MADESICARKIKNAYRSISFIATLHPCRQGLNSQHLLFASTQLGGTYIYIYNYIYIYIYIHNPQIICNKSLRLSSFERFLIYFFAAKIFGKKRSNATREKNSPKRPTLRETHVTSGNSLKVGGISRRDFRLKFLGKRKPNIWRWVEDDFLFKAFVFWGFMLHFVGLTQDDYPTQGWPFPTFYHDSSKHLQYGISLSATVPIRCLSCVSVTRNSLLVPLQRKQGAEIQTSLLLLLLLVVCCWLFVVGCWLLVVGCWLLVVGCWLLVVGCWLLVVVVVVVVVVVGGVGVGVGVGVLVVVVVVAGGGGANEKFKPLVSQIFHHAWNTLKHGLFVSMYFFGIINGCWKAKALPSSNRQKTQPTYLPKVYTPET